MSFTVRNKKLKARMSGNEYSWNRERGPCIASWDLQERFSTERVLRAFCEINNQALDWANEYGEPGYTEAPKGILLANWNHIPKSLSDRLERQGFQLEWSDEWMIDHDNGARAYRTSPDSHGWEPRVRACDGYYLTPESDSQKWIDDSLNDDSRPLPSWFDQAELESRGFELIDSDNKEVGFHPGQDETPEKFTAAIRETGADFVLQITNRGQFHVSYRIWKRAKCHEISDVAAHFSDHDIL